MTKTTIPKIIHYCWFGGAPLPKSAKRCIESWKKYCPDYEIIEWNENNFDINKASFTKEAHENKKWAFVSDYARYIVVYDMGGIYLDIDVELIKSLDSLVDLEAFMGFEGREYVATGLGFGARKGDKMLKEIINRYDNLSFEKHKDEVSKIATPIIVTDILVDKGLIANGELQKVDSVTVLPEDYLCPKNPITRLTNITKNTISIHHYDASWVDDKERAIIDKMEEDAKLVAAKFPDLVSILIPAYNAEDYLSEAVESALNQSYKNIEVLVIDDGSSDGTEQIANSYGQRIRYIKKENGGVASALNLGIKNMRGRYFSWLSHDDLYHRERVEILARQARNEDRKTILISDWDIIDSNGIKTGHSRLDNRLETSPRAFLAFDRNTWLNACAMLIPVELFDEVGFFDEQLRTTQDYDMHNRLISIGAKYKVIHKPLFISRQHSKQGSLIDSNALLMSDQIHSHIINDLSNEEILLYFINDYSEIDNVYKSFLSSGYKNTPARIIQRTVDALKEAGQEKQIVGLIERNSMGLGSDEANVVARIISSKVGTKNRTRLLFSSGYWRTGGMERVLSNLLKSLGDTYEIFLITPHEAGKACIELPKNVTHIKISSVLYHDSFDTVALSYALTLEIDVAIGFLNLFDKQLDFYLQCRENGIKTIASNHEYIFYPYKSHDSHIRELAKKRTEVYKTIDAVLWLTNFSTEVHNVSNDNGYLIENPNTYSMQKSNSVNKEKIILSIGRFNDYVKRIDRIIECFVEVKKRVPGAKLILVGNVDRKLRISRLDNRNIDEIIDLSGEAKNSIYFEEETNNISKYYKNANVYLLTSVSEGFPMVLTEAACHGVPAVSNEIPGLEDIIVNGKTGYIVPQDDIASMAESVSALLIDDSLRSKMGANAMEHASRFKIEIIADKWKLLINTLTSTESAQEKKAILRKELSPQLENRRKFEENLLTELNDSFKQSNAAIQELNKRLKEAEVLIHMGIIARFRRLVKSTIDENKKSGFKITFKKILRRVKNKLKFEVERAFNFGKKTSSLITRR